LGHTLHGEHAKHNEGNITK